MTTQTSVSKKEKIRKRYKGVDEELLNVIPALPQESLYDDTKEKRVAVYARVSTDDPRQTSSYELQRNHYIEMVSKRPLWKLIDIYADEGISGTSMNKRDAFLRMLADCHAGKIDLIVTKSVSRFSRNVVDCIEQIRKLKELIPPVGVVFETEGISTLDNSSEMSLTMIATIAQEESHTKSEVMNASIEMRYKRGIFLTPPLLGFDHDEDGNLIINESEAKTVRLIFFMYLYGYTSQQIADALTKLKCKTKKGNTQWSSGSVINVLQNERHCGDVLARKTWTPNYLTHKSKKNKQNRNSYYQHDHHTPIISRDDFIAVSKLISNAKYGNKGILPRLTVVKQGILKGFVSINPRWSNFKVDDYYHASSSIVTEEQESPINNKVEVNSGDFDLRGYEVVRGQFFDGGNNPRITFTSQRIAFSQACFNKLPPSLYVELLIHPSHKLLAVRPCLKDFKNKMQWTSIYDGKYKPRYIFGTAFLPTLFELLDWDITDKQRIIGTKQQKDDEAILLFDLKETETLLPSGAIPIDDADDNDSIKKPIDPLTTGTSKDILAYPHNWAYGFGNNFYHHGKLPDIMLFSDLDSWDAYMEGQPYKEPELNVTGSKEIEENIETIMDEIRQEVTNE